MNLKEYKSELEECLCFGPWSDFNPEKAMMLIRMGEMELQAPDLADLYCCYARCCFEYSVRFGEESRDYYEKALSVFDKLVALLDQQDTDAIFRDISEAVESTIGYASQTAGWASGYDWYLADKWESCKWRDSDDEDDEDDFENWDDPDGEET